MSDDVNYRDINSQLRRPLRCQFMKTLLWSFIEFSNLVNVLVQFATIRRLSLHVFHSDRLV